MSLSYLNKKIQDKEKSISQKKYLAINFTNYKLNLRTAIPALPNKNFSY